jgi:hypothetical protein
MEKAKAWFREHKDAVDSKIKAEICGINGDCCLIAFSEIERSRSLVS